MICGHKQKITVSKNRVMRSQKSEFSFYYRLTGSERKFVGSILVPESFYIHWVIIDITLAQIDTEFEWVAHCWQLSTNLK